MPCLCRLLVGAGLSLLLSGCGHQQNIPHTVPITRLPDTTSGRCLDGSQAAFYFDPASAPHHTKNWVLWLEGGGECVAEASCRRKSQNNLGSSKSYPSSINATNMPHFASADAQLTPATATWNRVWLKYCSADVWSGTRTQPANETFGLYFSGHLVVQAVVEQLRAHGLDSAETVVLGGDSAGGIGMWLNVGWLRDALPNAEVIAAPLAGWYSFAYQYTGPGSTAGWLPDFSEDVWPAYVELWQSHMDADCIAALAPHSSRCMLANFSRPHLRAVRAFVTEAQTDKVQISGHDLLPWTDPTNLNSDELVYVQAWKDNMTNMLGSGLNPQDGLFSPACYIHTSFGAQGPLLADHNGHFVNYGQAFAQWLQNLTVRYEDSCGLFCGHCHGDSSQLLLSV